MVCVRHRIWNIIRSGQWLITSAGTPSCCSQVLNLLRYKEGSGGTPMVVNLGCVATQTDPPGLGTKLVKEVTSS